MAERGALRELLEAIQDWIADLLALVMLGWLAPQPRDQRAATPTVEPDDPGQDVASVLPRRGCADDRLEELDAARHLVRDTREGRGREDDVSDEFLSQLEQRTQQVKITLANLEAEKVRIENQIAQLQPLVPHYDALLAAERQITDAHIALEAASPATEQAAAESSGWASDAPAQEDAAQGESAGGWSGSWNS